MRLAPHNQQSAFRECVLLIKQQIKESQMSFHAVYQVRFSFIGKSYQASVNAILIEDLIILLCDAGFSNIHVSLYDLI